MDWEVTLLFGHCTEPATYFKYQHFFLLGLELEEIPVRFSPRLNEPLSTAFRRGTPKTQRIWRWHSRLRHHETGTTEGNHVGRYLFRHRSGPRLKVAIDSADGRHIRDPGAYEWSDIYFKSNRWESLSYPAKVRPLINGNGLLSEAAFQELRGLRTTPKDCDLIYWSNLWKIPGQVRESSRVIEHQIRLFETLAQSDCRKDLLAILKQDPADPSYDRVKRRLDAANVPWQVGWQDIDSQRFWQSHARARLACYRPGNHLCISWRLSGLLCMGATTVLDAPPYPQWYQPLVRDTHYAAADCGLYADYALPPLADYRSLLEVIDEHLEHPERARRIGEHAARYHDRHGSPTAAVRHITGVLNEISANCPTWAPSPPRQLRPSGHPEK